MLFTLYNVYNNLKPFLHIRCIRCIRCISDNSKTCNSCAYKLDKLPLSIREWTCPNCNHHQLRDVGAAINILGEGRSLVARGVSNGGGLIEQSIDPSYDTAKRESPIRISNKAKREVSDLVAGASIL